MAKTCPYESPSGSMNRGSRSSTFLMNGFSARLSAAGLRGLNKPHPNPAFAPPHQVVRIARQVVEQHLGLGRAALHVQVTRATIALPQPVAAIQSAAQLRGRNASGFSCPERLYSCFSGGYGNAFAHSGWTNLDFWQFAKYPPDLAFLAWSLYSRKKLERPELVTRYF